MKHTLEEAHLINSHKIFPICITWPTQRFLNRAGPISWQNIWNESCFTPPTDRSLPPPIKPPSLLWVKRHFFGSWILFAVPNTDSPKKANQGGQICSRNSRKTPPAAEQGEQRALRIWVNRPPSSWRLDTDQSSLLLDLTFMLILYPTP